MNRIILFTLLYGCLLQAAAQPSREELKNLINQSFNYFPKFRELDQAVRTSQQRVELASLGNKPTIGAALDYNYVWPVPSIDFPNGNGGSQKFEFQPNHNINTFTIPLFICKKPYHWKIL